MRFDKDPRGNILVGHITSHEIINDESISSRKLNGCFELKPLKLSICMKKY